MMLKNNSFKKTYFVEMIKKNKKCIEGHEFFEVETISAHSSDFSPIRVQLKVFIFCCDNILNCRKYENNLFVDFFQNYT